MNAGSNARRRRPRRTAARKSPAIGRGMLALLLLLLVAGGSWAAWHFLRQAGDEAAEKDAETVVPVDPRLASDTPFRNVHPDVQYVDDAACTECHAPIAESYALHPMGNSLRPVHEAAPIEEFAPRAGNPFERDGYIYETLKKGTKWSQTETLRDAQGETVSHVEVPLEFAIGAGRHARSYLFERDGSLFYSPVTWYSAKSAWDISPAFVDTPHHFTDPVSRSCMFCHANRLAPREGGESKVRFVDGTSIGCQRCHGPGELHVARHQQGDVPDDFDDTIVNPAKLEPRLRDAVCEQCHLEGKVRLVRRGRDEFDYRPGLPLHEFVAVFVPADKDATLFVGHSEQMRASGCYLGTEGKLGCISCHDPHHLPAEVDRVDSYRRRCLECHEKQPCDEPVERRLKVSPADDCAACHMPRRPADDVDHVAITDHRVPRKPPEPMQSQQTSEKKPTRIPGRNEPLLLNFHQAALDAGDVQSRRDLGIALNDWAYRQEDALFELTLRRALPLLAAAVERDPQDAAAWTAYGRTLWGLNRQEEGLVALRKAIEIAPDDERALWNACKALNVAGLNEEAAAAAQRLVDATPGHPKMRTMLADALLAGGQFSQAAQEYSRVLEQNPADLMARQGLATALLQGRKVDEAAAQFSLNLEHDQAFLPSLQGLGECLYRQARWREAAAVYERCLGMDATMLPVRQRLIECYEKLNDRQRADELRRAAP